MPVIVDETLPSAVRLNIPTACPENGITFP